MLVQLEGMKWPGMVQAGLGSCRMAAWLEMGCISDCLQQLHLEGQPGFQKFQHELFQLSTFGVSF